MDHAKALLLDTDLAVSEVAEQAGYHRQSSFSTAFKEHHGCRPLDLRRRISGTITRHLPH
jgi:AraC-like DNA-binding protein